MIEILNWEKFQHYRHRNPPWIRLHTNLQDKPEYRNMTAQARALLVDLWLMAAKEKGGCISKDVQTIAWELREIEIETCLALREIAEVKDIDGNSQWVEWTLTGIDRILLAQCTPVASTLLAERTQVASESISEPIRIESSEDVKNKIKLENLNTLPLPQKTRASTVLAEQTTLIEEIEPKSEPEAPPEPLPMPEAHVTEESFEPEAGADTWLTPYALAYEIRMGKGSFNYGRAAGPMKKLEMVHGKAQVQLNWACACESEDTRYLNPQTFKEKFATYNPANQAISELTPPEHLAAG